MYFKSLRVDPISKGISPKGISGICQLDIGRKMFKSSANNKKSIRILDLSILNSIPWWRRPLKTILKQPICRRNFSIFKFVGSQWIVHCSCHRIQFCMIFLCALEPSDMIVKQGTVTEFRFTVADKETHF